MINITQLKEQDRQAAEAKRAAEERRKREEEEWRQQKLARDLARADELTAGGMDELFLALNAEGVKQFRMFEYHVDDGGFSRRDFKIGFAPDPDYKPTKKLVAALKQAGFKAQVITEMVHNTQCEHYGDGEYRFVDVPGTHPEHHILVDWTPEEELTVGARVVTVQPETESDDWNSEALASRRWGVRGTVVECYTGYDLVYEVEHDGGSIGYYEPHEIVKL